MQIRKAMTQAGQRHMLTGIVKMMEKTQPLKVIAGAPDRPLITGDIEIPCYVLEDETRVLSQRGVTCAIKLNPDVGFRMPQFLSSKALYFSGVTAGFFSPYSVQKSILEKFIAKELQPWTKTFPYEFSQQILRLKGWPGPEGVRGPRVSGHYTNDLVYERLAPGVLSELRRLNPKMPHGSRKNKHHQWFTPGLGHPKLKEHLAAVIMLMKAAPNWQHFKRSLDRGAPKLNDTLPLPF